MRVLVLLTDAFGSRGGIARFNQGLLGALCAYPETAEVVAIPRLWSFEIEPLPAKLTYVTDGVNSTLGYIGTVLKTLRSNPAFDLILIGHLNLLPLIFLVRLLVDAPAFAILHGLEAWSPRSRLFRRCLKWVEGCISVSQLTKSRFCAWSGFWPDRVLLLPNSVDLNQYTPGLKNADLTKRYRLQGKQVLMTLGRLDTRERAKGFDEVLETLTELSKEFPNVSYMIAGDGTDRARLEQKAKCLGVAEHVVFTGFVPEAEKADHYRLADAYVMPSRVEGFGIVFLEAMACGVPIVASKIDGSREAARDGAWGIVVDPDNREELKEGIVQILKRPRGVRPAGLEYYSSVNFERRVHQVVAWMLEARSNKGPSILKEPMGRSKDILL